MNFTGNVYRVDQIVAADVLGFCSGTRGRMAGSMVLIPGQTLPCGEYTLVTTGGLVQQIHVLSSSGQPHQATLVEFVSGRLLTALFQEFPDVRAVPGNLESSVKER